MKKEGKKRRLCASLYHKKWFRILLLLVGLDMVILAFAFTIEIDVLQFTQAVSLVPRLIFGFMYMIAALFLIHYALAYKKIKEEACFVCHHCLDEKLEK